MINYSFKIELTDERTKYTEVVFTSGDVRGYRLNFSFFEDGKPTDVKGCILAVKAKRADEAVITDSGVITAEGEAYYDVKSSMISVPGELSFEIALSDEGGMYVVTKELCTTVREGYGEADLAASDKTPVLSSLLSAAAKAQSMASEAAEKAETAQSMASESEVFAEGVREDSRQNFANAIKGSAAGESVIIADSSPVMHEAEVKAVRKNLIDISTAVQTTYANVSINGDELTVTGYLTYVKIYGLEAGKQYTYSWEAERSSEYGGGFALERFYTDGTRKLVVSGYDHMPEKSPYTFTMAEDVEYIMIYFYGGKYLSSSEDWTTATYRNVQLEEGTEATEYTPYIPDMTAVNVLKQGKNLIPFPYEFAGAGESVTCEGITATVLADGGIELSGTSNSLAIAHFALCSSGKYIKPTSELAEDNPTDGIYVLSGNHVKANSSGDVFISIMGDTTVDEVIYPQIEIGTVPTEYEIYSEPVLFSVSSDGTAEGVMLSGENILLASDTEGVKLECVYNQDTNKVIEKLTNAIISLGGNV